MATYTGKKFLQHLNKKNRSTKIKKVLIMGVTFKENCPDVRNSKVMDVYYYLKNKKIKVDLYDPIANVSQFEKLYKLKLIKKINKNFYDGILISTRHLEFVRLGLNNIKKYAKKNSVVFDLKSVFPEEKTDFSL